MAQCPTCGTTVADQLAVCTTCGTPLSSAVMADLGRDVPPPPHLKKSPVRAAVPAASALVLSLAWQWGIASVIPADAYLHRLFRPAGGWIMSLVPALILFSLIWALADLLLKHRIGRVNERDLARSEVKGLPSLVAKEPPTTTVQRLRGWDQRMLKRPVGHRVNWLLHHLDAATDPQRMHELLRHRSDLDADEGSSGYRTVKLFTWAMPILGFIGTVLGISLAVGGFSEFLTTSVSIDEIDRVTTELGNVAQGLSFAFDTTLLGLLAGLVATVVTAAVQDREERFLTGLDELGLRIMENSAVRPNGARPEPAAPSDAPTEAFGAEMRARLDDLSGRLERFTEISDSIVSRTQQLLQGLNQSGQGLAESITGTRAAVDRLGAALQGVSGGLAESVAGLAERVATSEGQVRAGLSELQRSIETDGERSAATQHAIRELSAAIATFGDGLERRVASSEEQVRAGLAELQRSIETDGERSVATQHAIRELSAAIATFGDRLADLKSSQESLAPVLSQLAGPLELRLMPSAPPRPGPGGGD